MQSQIVPAVIALVGVLAGVLVRDVVMTLVAVRRKRTDELADRGRDETKARIDLIRRYSLPVRAAAESLRIRLDEFIEKRPYYFSSSTPVSEFVAYKRLSTLYRVAALLGWIRAFQRERILLDPEDQAGVSSLEKIASALADGQHVESHRLSELCALWNVAPETDRDGERLAAEIDAILRASLVQERCLTAAQLEPPQRLALAETCARSLRARLRADIPGELVSATVDQAVVLFGIREAYLYRDWQAAIGDLMIRDVSGSARRFDVIGFGQFESRYLTAYSGEASEDRRWFERLERLFLDLDMGKTGVFDARREQVGRLKEACKQLVEELDGKAAILALAVEGPGSRVDLRSKTKVTEAAADSGKGAEKPKANAEQAGKATARP